MMTDTYPKTEAKILAAQRRRDEGGTWDIEPATPAGRKYRVVQRETRRQLAVRHAQITLSFDVFDPECPTSFYKERARLEEELDAFRAKFAENPFNALEWATGTCQVAADYKIVGILISYRERGVGLHDILEWLEDEARREDSFESLSISTSSMANLMARAERIAMRKYARQMRSYHDSRREAEGALYAASEGI